MSNQILGLAQPRRWVQPRTDAELIERLRQAAEYAVHERERENLCSTAAARLSALLRSSDFLSQYLNEGDGVYRP